MKKNIVLRI